MRPRRVGQVTAYDTNGTPVETNDMVLVGERYELIYELPAE